MLSRAFALLPLLRCLRLRFACIKEQGDKADTSASPPHWRATHDLPSVCYLCCAASGLAYRTMAGVPQLLQYNINGLAPVNIYVATSP
jgi:hypothetical protein